MTSPPYTEMFTAKEAKRKTALESETSMRDELSEAYKHISTAISHGLYTTTYSPKRAHLTKPVVKFFKDMGFEVDHYDTGTNEVAIKISWENADVEEEE